MIIVDLSGMGNGIRPMSSSSPMGSAQVAGRLEKTGANVARSGRAVERSVSQMKSQYARPSGNSRIDIKA